VAQFRYRLQMLLDEKIRAKEEAEHSLAAAHRHLRAAHEEMEECVRLEKASAERLRCARVALVSSVVDGSCGGQIRWRRDYTERLHDEYRNASDATRAQELTVAEARERLSAAREILVSRSRDVEVLEKHKSKLECRFNAAAARQETLDHEEMANVIFLQRRRVI
jgi:YscO-like protein